MGKFFLLFPRLLLRLLSYISGPSRCVRRLLTSITPWPGPVATSAHIHTRERGWSAPLLLTNFLPSVVVGADRWITIFGHTIFLPLRLYRLLYCFRAPPRGEGFRWRELSDDAFCRARGLWWAGLGCMVGQLSFRPVASVDPPASFDGNVFLVLSPTSQALASFYCCRRGSTCARGKASENRRRFCRRERWFARAGACFPAVPPGIVRKDGLQSLLLGKHCKYPT